jgi:hypothetical protein
LSRAAFLLAAGAFALTGFAAHAETLMLEVGVAEVVRTTGKASTILLGDPSVAEVTTIDETTLVVAGKKPGRTTLIVFDAAAMQVLSADVRIGSPVQALRQRVYKGTTGVVQEFRCSAFECAGPWAVRPSVDNVSALRAEASAAPEVSRPSTPQAGDEPSAPADP